MFERALRQLATWIGFESNRANLHMDDRLVTIPALRCGRQAENISRLDLSPAHSSYAQHSATRLAPISREGSWQNLTANITMRTWSSGPPEQQASRAACVDRKSRLGSVGSRACWMSVLETKLKQVCDIRCGTAGSWRHRRVAGAGWLCRLGEVEGRPYGGLASVTWMRLHAETPECPGWPPVAVRRTFIGSAAKGNSGSGRFNEGCYGDSFADPRRLYHRGVGDVSWYPVR